MPEKALIFSRTKIVSGETEFTFGIHEGKTFRQIEEEVPSYIKWVLEHVTETSGIGLSMVATYFESKYLLGTDGSVYDRSDGTLKYRRGMAPGTAPMAHTGGAKSSGGSKSSSAAPMTTTAPTTPLARATPARQLLEAVVTMSTMDDHVFQEAASQIDTLPENRRAAARVILQMVYDQFVMDQWYNTP
jgi:hypothetical protein